MYTVKKYHYRPAYRKGDLEAETIMIGSYSFKTRKEAKDFIERELRGKKDVYRNYHKGNKKSNCEYFTDRTWIHENTGDTCTESFSYILEKVQL